MFLFADSSHFPLFLFLPLSQVSNWFANARRRLKNTVRQPDLSWALRIKLYNKYVQGNAERLSVSSDDSCSEGTARAAAPVPSSKFHSEVRGGFLSSREFKNSSYHRNGKLHCGPRPSVTGYLLKSQSMHYTLEMWGCKEESM